jgi:hypothetical protein
MRLVIAYDQRGQIVTVAKMYRLPEDMPHPFADLLAEHRVLSIEEPKGELREMRLVEIQHQFSVNMVKGELVRKQQKSRQKQKS